MPAKTQGRSIHGELVHFEIAFFCEVFRYIQAGKELQLTQLNASGKRHIDIRFADRVGAPFAVFHFAIREGKSVLLLGFSIKRFGHKPEMFAVQACDQPGLPGEDDLLHVEFAFVDGVMPVDQ